MRSLFITTDQQTLSVQASSTAKYKLATITTTTFNHRPNGS